MNKKEKAFTLAETLVTLTILGVVAAITVPNLVRKQVERTNRTKVKKAMAAYESALNKMVIENDLRSDQALRNWANQSPNCGNTAKYFKQAEGSGCQFKTSDGVWWNISDIETTLISLKKIDESNPNQNYAKIKLYAKNYCDKSAFYLISSIDNHGILRVSDLPYEYKNRKSYEVAHQIFQDCSVNRSITYSYNYVAKVYSFINNEYYPEKDFYGNQTDFAHSEWDIDKNGRRIPRRELNRDGQGYYVAEYNEKGELERKSYTSELNSIRYIKGEEIYTNGELTKKIEYQPCYFESCSEAYGDYNNARISSLLTKETEYYEGGGNITKSVTEYNNTGIKRKTTSYHEDGTTEKEKITYHTSDAANGSYKAGDIQSHYIYNEQGSNTYRKNVFGEYKYEYDTNGTTLLRTYRMNNTTGEWELQ